MAQLTVMIHQRPGRQYRIDGKTRIGRDSGNDVQILDQKVSRHHVSIENVRGFYIVRDLRSRNGTFLNDVKIKESELKTGDRIRIGNTEIVFTESLESEKSKLHEFQINPDVSSSHDDVHELDYDFRKLKDLINRLETPGDKAIFMARLSQLLALASTVRPIESGSLVFQEIQEMIHQMFPVDRSFILLKDPHDAAMRLEAVRSISETDNHPDFGKDVFLPVINRCVSLLFRPGFNHPAGHQDSVADAVSRTGMCVPVRYGVKVLGMLYTDTGGGPDRLTESDLVLFSALGAIAGVIINAWIVYKDIRLRTFSALSILSDHLDSRLSEAVRGRTRRIARRVSALCEQMGLPDDQIETITLAAYISTTLKTPQTDNAITETLPEGFSLEEKNDETDLIQDIESRGGMAEIARILRSQNENFDGTGFPEGLTGTVIPLGSRIIRAVSKLEFLSSNEQLMAKELQLLSGSVLDPMIVRILMSCIHNFIQIGMESDQDVKLQLETDSIKDQQTGDHTK